MSYNIYLLSDQNTKTLSSYIARKVHVDKVYESPDLELTSDILLDMANRCLTEHFYVLSPVKPIYFTDVFYEYRPDYPLKELTHIWGNKQVRLFKKENVMKNPEMYDDCALASGSMELFVADNIVEIFKSNDLFDIIFLSYDEDNAEERFREFKKRFPRAIHLHGIKGILAAHIAAAHIANQNNSAMFYVVDADADVLPTFKFDFVPLGHEMNSVHIWYSKNPINGLEYGYGGVKLFPTESFLSSKKNMVDMSTAISGSVKIMPEVSNITRFNTNPFTTWRSAFRECVKLSSRLIDNQADHETEHRLNVWCRVGDGEFGEFSVMGACEGREYGELHKDQPEKLGLINDYSWLESKFNS